MTLIRTQALTRREILQRRRAWLGHLFILVMGVAVGVIAYALSRLISISSG